MLYSENKLEQCREQCLQILEHARCPIAIEVVTLQLLSAVVPTADGLQYLHKADSIIQTLNQDNPNVQFLKQENATTLEELQQKEERERAMEKESEGEPKA